VRASGLSASELLAAGVIVRGCQRLAKCDSANEAGPLHVKLFAGGRAAGIMHNLRCD